MTWVQRHLHNINKAKRIKGGRLTQEYSKTPESACSFLQFSIHHCKTGFTLRSILNKPATFYCNGKKNISEKCNEHQWKSACETWRSHKKVTLNIMGHSFGFSCINGFNGRSGLADFILNILVRKNHDNNDETVERPESSCESCILSSSRQPHNDTYQNSLFKWFHPQIVCNVHEIRMLFYMSWFQS